MTRTGFYLLDRIVPGPRKWYAANTEKQGGVQHITAGLEDLDLGNDQSAEATARYCANTDRAVSWHDGVDTNSVVRLLPGSYTAFHCKGANLSGVGQEISKKSTRWADMPAAWVAATLHNSAEAWRPHVRRFGWPLRVLTAEEWRRGLKGFIEHSKLDPSRRSDPGGDFPWDDLFHRIAHPGEAPPSPTGGRRTLSLRSPMQRGADVRALQQAIGAVPADGVFGPATEVVLRGWQSAHGLVPDGICGPATWARIDEETSGALRPEGDFMAALSHDEQRELLNLVRTLGPRPDVFGDPRASRDAHDHARFAHFDAWQALQVVKELRREVAVLREQVAALGQGEP